MSHRRRCIGALLTVLIAASAAGCAGGPPPSCGEFTLDQGESIPQEAVDCMSEGGEDRALKVTVASVEGDPIVTTYATAVCVTDAATAAAALRVSSPDVNVTSLTFSRNSVNGALAANPNRLDVSFRLALIVDAAITRRFDQSIQLRNPFL